ncbi:SGNH/GDSL hydrolase family protein [Neobacillus dielmonensis]|uniref:SGNH/GDSL hydrolase family protein n=1 Tax=Neobacillus dielmonensis TaxID=1347369 RepID=UPI0005A94402|nr:GDSL-type esterase/lipase family protein [Neobacillus dielmonensis]
MKFKRLSLLFVFMLVFQAFFASFVLADTSEKKSIVALGDSITHGWNLGDDHSSTQPINEQAFPYLIQPSEYTVAKNISGGGWKTTDLFSAINNSPENQAAIKNADVITLDIGNNDLLQVPEAATILAKLRATPPVMPTQEEMDAAKVALVKSIPTLASNLGTVLGTVRALNPDAQIIFYNLYNPFGSEPLKSFGEGVIPAINTNVITPLAAQFGAVVVDAYSAFNGKQAELILPGDIHPTVTGHQVLAKLANDLLPSDFAVNLTPSTTEPTSGPVTITVSTDAVQPATMKWLAGEKTVADFQTAGTEITGSQFAVTENGKYSVFVKDAKGIQKVEVIEVTAIKSTSEQPSGNNSGGGSTQPENNSGSDSSSAGNTTTNTQNTVGSSSGTTTGHTLPNTASPIYNYLLLGTALVIIGLAARKAKQAVK